jgi:hypothetical protein
MVGKMRCARGTGIRDLGGVYSVRGGETTVLAPVLSRWSEAHRVDACFVAPIEIRMDGSAEFLTIVCTPY